MTQRILRITLTGLWFLLIAGVFYMSLVPSGRIGGQFDKLVHFGVYACLAMPAVFLYVRRSTVHACATALVAMSGLIEILQGQTSYRSASWLDFLCNGLGVTLGILAARKLEKALWRFPQGAAFLSWLGMTPPAHS